jgi:hypothetical protein
MAYCGDSILLTVGLAVDGSTSMASASWLENASQILGELESYAKDSGKNLTWVQGPKDPSDRKGLTTDSVSGKSLRLFNPESPKFAAMAMAAIAANEGEFDANGKPAPAAFNRAAAYAVDEGLAIMEVAKVAKQFKNGSREPKVATAKTAIPKGAKVTVSRDGTQVCAVLFEDGTFKWVDELKTVSPQVDLKWRKSDAPHRARNANGTFKAS